LARTIGISSADYAATKFCNQFQNQFRTKNLKVLHTVIEPFPLCLSLYLRQQNSHHVSISFSLFFYPQKSHSGFVTFILMKRNSLLADLIQYKIMK